MPAKKISQIQASQARYSDGQSIIDREGVSSLASQNARMLLSVSAFDESLVHGALQTTKGPARFNPSCLTDIHAIFPYQNQQYVTAVGRGLDVGCR